MTEIHIIYTVEDDPGGFQRIVDAKVDKGEGVVALDPIYPDVICVTPSDPVWLTLLDSE